MEFVKSAVSWGQFPEKHLPEVVLAGRSNSGKSSFVNCLARTSVAKVSQKPGKTRLLNIFNMGQKCYLVDMPGYGYAARSATERIQWQKMVEGYLVDSERIAGLVLLMDIRRTWSEDEDILYQFCLSRDIPMVLGLTKADKLSKSKWKSVQLKTEKSLGIPCFALSSTKKWGITEVMGHALKNWM